MYENNLNKEPEWVILEAQQIWVMTANEKTRSSSQYVINLLVVGRLGIPASAESHYTIYNHFFERLYSQKRKQNKIKINYKKKTYI